MIDNITAVYTQLNCACLCYANVKCLTATYFGISQYCILYLASLNQGTLSLMTTNTMTNVLTFKNKTLPAPTTFIDVNDTIFEIWNTTVGDNSHTASVGFSNGNYPSGQDSAQVFDGNTTTKYVSFGICNLTFAISPTVCGVNTGMYVSPRRGISLLLGFRFWTADSFPPCDPILVTIEGSCQPLTNLTSGSSWTLIYNDSSGLDNNPGRLSGGVTKWISNNSVWYTSYRILVLSKRGSGQFVQYSEVELFGY